MNKQKSVNVRTNVLSKNTEIANENRKYFVENKIFVMNLISSPGSGKTSILERTLSELKNHTTIAVIEGDQETTNDAERIQKTGVPVHQINTVNSCHLNAQQVKDALSSLNIEEIRPNYLFIENVGNLICPSSYDLGEAIKIVMLSTTEGEDKPIKYPGIFAKSEVMILNKTDLVPHLDFDVEKCLQYAKQVNPKIKIFSVSAKTGEGFDDWLSWLKSKKL